MSSKVVDFDTNRKRVCDFLLVRHSNLGPILHRLGDIADFLCSYVTPPLFHSNFRGVPDAPARPCRDQPSTDNKECSKLAARISIQCDGRTSLMGWRHDGQTECHSM